MNKYIPLLQQRLDSFEILTEEDKSNMSESKIAAFYQAYKNKFGSFTIKMMTGSFLSSLGFICSSSVLVNEDKYQLDELKRLVKFRFGTLVKKDSNLNKISKKIYEVSKK